MPFLLKQYDVSVYAETRQYHAATPGLARAKAYSDYIRSYPDTCFREFLKIAVVRKSTAPLPEGFGKPILVGHKPAYQVQDLGHATRYVWPGSDRILLSHHMDVEPAPTSNMKESA